MQQQSFYYLNTVSIITYYVENESLIILHKFDRNLFHLHVMYGVYKPADSSFFVWSKNGYILTDEVLMRPSSKLAQM